ncbi:hypothetical protein RQCS_62500 (plasmid) [Rhodococcus qingshengii]|nr:hypothetical protein RQCS_62500 [Rhodococcus qingshengii]
MIGYGSPVSLTTQINSPDSPFMRFAQRSIPNSSAVTTVHDGVHRAAVKTKSSHTGTRPDWGLIGTAIDFRLRLAFTTADLVPLSARRGYADLSRSYPESSSLLVDLATATAVVLADAAPFAADRIELPESLENDLIRLCVVAGQLDQLYRNYPFVIDKTPLLKGGSIVTFEQACAQVPWFVIDQIHDQVSIANTGLGPLHANATRADAGMSFAGSHLIGGADADLLVDGLLLDFKSTHATTTISKSDVYQLAGYALLDFDDEHHIERVGIYWTRHGVMRTFTLPTFFRVLGATAPLADLRAELRADLDADYQRRRASFLAGKATHEHTVTIEQSPQPHHGTKLSRSIDWLRGVLRR